MGKISKVVSMNINDDLDWFLEDYWFQNISKIDIDEYESFKIHQRKLQNMALAIIQKSGLTPLADSSMMYIDKDNHISLVVEVA